MREPDSTRALASGLPVPWYSQAPGARSSASCPFHAIERRRPTATSATVGNVWLLETEHALVLQDQLANMYFRPERAIVLHFYLLPYSENDTTVTHARWIQEAVLKRDHVQVLLEAINPGTELLAVIEDDENT